MIATQTGLLERVKKDKEQNEEENEITNEVTNEIETEEPSQDYIIYNANGGENAPESQSISNNTISILIPTRENYVFAGWGTTSDTTEITYKGGETYTGEESITLYAIWLEKIEYLENNGVEYIDTGYYPNQDTSIEFIATPIEDTTKIELAWFGSRNNISNTTNAKAYVLWASYSKFSMHYNNTETAIDTSKVTVTQNEKYKIYINKNITYVNEVEYIESTYQDFSSTSTLVLYGAKTYTASIYNIQDTVDYRTSKLKLYSCKIWDDETLVRDYIPVKDFNGVECLYDSVDKKLYYLQSDVTEIEYIESSGTQYIDTGFKPNQDTSIEFIATPLEDTTGTERAWFGSRNNTSGNTNGKAYVLWSINNNFNMFYNNTETAIDTSKITVTQNEKYKIYIDKNITYINDEQYIESSYGSFTSPSTLTLFTAKTYTATKYNSANSVDYRMASLKLYSCKIWDNGTLVRDFVPVKYKDGKLGLLEKISKKVYYNSGSGSFTASE